MAKKRESHWEGDSDSPEETPDFVTQEEASRRAEVLACFLAERPWERTLQERHACYLSMKDEQIPAEDIMEFACSLVTGLHHIGRQGYTGPDKPPFDLESADQTLFVDAKLFDSGDSKAQNRLKVKHERPRKQFKRWHEGGEKAIPCQLARGRKAWFLIPGIPIKDVPLGKAIGDELTADDPMKPVRLLDTADITEWNNFQRLHTAWSEAIALLRENQELVMSTVRQKREEFTAKDAREILEGDYERPVWVATAYTIPEATQEIIAQGLLNEDVKQQIAQQAFQDEQTSQQFVEEAFQHERSKQQIVEQVCQDEEARQQVVQEAFLHKSSKQQIVAQALQDKEAKQQFAEQALQDKETKQRIVGRVRQDDDAMRELLGEDLYLLWKARQQSGESTTQSPAPKNGPA